MLCLVRETDRPTGTETHCKFRRHKWLVQYRCWCCPCSWTRCLLLDEQPAWTTVRINVGADLGQLWLGARLATHDTRFESDSAHLFVPKFCFDAVLRICLPPASSPATTNEWSMKLLIQLPFFMQWWQWSFSIRSYQMSREIMSLYYSMSVVFFK